MVFSKLFSRRGSPARPEATAAPTPAPERFDLEGTLYVVGDVHGCARQLRLLLRKLVEDAGAPETRWPIELAFVGDYVDRGRDSREALDILRGLLDEREVAVTFLKGNHEAMLLDFIDDPLGMRDWLVHGGLQTLDSFGVRGAPPTASDDALRACADQLREALGDLHDFLSRRLVLSRRVGNVFICHAAADRDAPPDAQPEQTLLWGAERFLREGGPPGLWVAHGHTIVSEAGLYGARIAVDTGAYAGGPLTAARIEAGPAPESCRFIQASRSELPPRGA